MKNNKLEPKTEEFVKDETQFEDKKETVQTDNGLVVIVNVPNLNKRNGPGREYKAVGFAPEGKVELSEIYKAQDGRVWGRLKDKQEWIDLEWTRKA